MRLVAPLLLAGTMACSGTTDVVTSPSTAGSTSPEPSQSHSSEQHETTPPIWDFTARKLGGGEINGAQFAGKKVAVWLWAPWCGPCGRLAPTVAQAAKDNPDITFLGVPGQDSDSAHQRFVDEHGLSHITHAIDERRALWGHFGSSTQEAWLFIDEDGDVGARTRYGEMSADALQGYLDDLKAA